LYQIIGYKKRAGKNCATAGPEAAESAGKCYLQVVDLERPISGKANFFRKDLCPVWDGSFSPSLLSKPPAPETRFGPKKSPRKRQYSPIFFPKDFSEKVLTEQTKVRVVDIFPSWEGAL
jgi:hypothetical protein